MAMSISEPIAELSDGTNSQTYALGAFTPTANAVLVAFVITEQTEATGVQGTVSGGGLSWSLVTEEVATGAGLADWRASAWTAKTGASPGSTTFIWDRGSGTCLGGEVCMFEIVPDVVATSPIRQSAKSSNAASANPTVTFASAMATTSGYCEAVGINTNPAAVTHPTGWTETVDTGHTGPTFGFHAAYRVGGETGTSVATTHASARWIMVAVEVLNDNPAAAAPLLMRHYEG